MRTAERVILSLGLLLGGAVAANAAPRPVVVELYTSEGCSSCPAAEAYIGELAQRSDVLALAFHVDYWDNLGWRDRFALPELSPDNALMPKACASPRSIRRRPW